jgi:abortive infection bacteriophage resistance protein
MRTPAGIFMSTVPQNYCKPALSLDDQISLLTRRGLTIPDRNKALHYLSVIGYYRLSGYFLTFLDTTTGVPSH